MQSNSFKIGPTKICYKKSISKIKVIRNIIYLKFFSKWNVLDRIFFYKIFKCRKLTLKTKYGCFLTLHDLCPRQFIDLNVSNFEYLFWFFPLLLPIENYKKYSRFKFWYVQIDELLRTQIIASLIEKCFLFVFFLVGCASFYSESVDMLKYVAICK